MSQRNSGFERVANDLYQTPDWVTKVLVEKAFPIAGVSVWEPACGEGKMARTLSNSGAAVVEASDIVDHGFDRMSFKRDFFSDDPLPFAGPPLPFARPRGRWSIITNPPYGPRGTLALRFIERGLRYLHGDTNTGATLFTSLALLLPVDCDSAKTRRHVFGDCPMFERKIVLTRRIEWFERQPGQAGPSSNHAWFVWLRFSVGDTKLFYGP